MLFNAALLEWALARQRFSSLGLPDEAKVSFAQDKKSPVTCVTGQFFQFHS
jgi:hypothetical protein